MDGHVRQSGGYLLVAAACVACTIIGLATGQFLAHPRPVTPPMTATRPAAPRRTPPSPANESQSQSVYGLLPVSATQIDGAAALAVRFTELYGTYSYAEPAPLYLARLRPFASAALYTVLAGSAADPGIQRLRVLQRNSAACTATVDGIRDIAGNTITFIIGATEITRSWQTIRTAATRYAVTSAFDGTRWLVDDIEPATAGQAGARHDHLEK
jgi:hypothetical protein